ncbi:hypothetical protein KIN20_021410 [Parelaphostrongylus tenuis]|uniref:Uncharacterized protein n=1 Tax=Parelaphostrongylus tenuis TaxID=148309 RepID=A0AAD5MSQ8_PARTN|nr:hypothetical protein KIN20_021410 [Parelaphostrongylus tenuis]
MERDLAVLRPSINYKPEKYRKIKVWLGITTHSSTSLCWSSATDVYHVRSGMLFRSTNPVETYPVEVGG